MGVADIAVYDVNGRRVPRAPGEVRQESVRLSARSIANLCYSMSLCATQCYAVLRIAALARRQGNAKSLDQACFVIGMKQLTLFSSLCHPSHSWVYVLRRRAPTGEIYKIGHSTEPRQRAQHLRAELVAVMPGGAELERDLHRRFAVDRLP